MTIDRVEVVTIISTPTTLHSLRLVDLSGEYFGDKALELNTQTEVFHRTWQQRVPIRG